MYKDFFVCDKHELKVLLDRENKRHKSTPKVYFMGYTLETVYWGFCDDGEDYYDCNLEHDFADVWRCCVVYSDYSKKEIQEKFFDYLVMESYKSKNYEEIAIGGDDYYIDVYFNEDELYSIYGFRWEGELSEEDIECLKSLAD